MGTLLEYQLGVLQHEMETINSAILNKDDASRQLKTWAISLWTATTTLTGVEHFALTENQFLLVLNVGNVPVCVETRLSGAA